MVGKEKEVGAVPDGPCDPQNLIINDAINFHSAEVLQGRIGLRLWRTNEIAQQVGAFRDTSQRKSSNILEKYQRAPFLPCPKVNKNS